MEKVVLLFAIRPGAGFGGRRRKSGGAPGCLPSVTAVTGDVPAPEHGIWEKGCSLCCPPRRVCQPQPPRDAELLGQ